MSDNDLNNPYTEPEAPRMGRRRPHVPSSKTNNVKEPPTILGGQPRHPVFYTGGLLSVYVGDRGVSAVFEAAFPSGEAASKAGS